MTDPTPLTLDPATTALLVMDAVPAILAHVADADALLGRIRTATDAARHSGATVAYARLGLTPDDRAAVPAVNKAFSRMAAAGWFADDDASTQVHSSVAPHDGDLVVRKVRFGALSTTDLDATLRERGVTTLVPTGVATGGVVLSTVRDAADRDYRLVVLADPDPQVHEILIGKVIPAQADVVTVDDLVTALSG